MGFYNLHILIEIRVEMLQVVVHNCNVQIYEDVSVIPEKSEFILGLLFVGLGLAFWV